MSVHDLCCIGYITQDKIVTTKIRYTCRAAPLSTLRMPLSISIRAVFIGHGPCRHRNECRGGYTERGHRGENSAQRPFRLL